MAEARPRRISRRTFGGMLFAGNVVIALPQLLGGCANRPVGLRFHDGLPRGAPGEHGVDARGVWSFLEGAAQPGLELHSFMLYRHGHVVAEGWWWPYRAERRHMMHSLTKSVTACGVGLAIEEGRFGLDDKVVSFFEQELPVQVSENLAAMTVRDLLTMRTGHAEGVSGSVWRRIPTSWVAEFFKLPVVQRPGIHFMYSSAATFMLSGIVTKTTGLGLREYLEPRLLRPLGIHDLEWDSGPGGINPGGNGLSWTTASMLKLGIVHLQSGRWGERQILPAEWVRAATRQQVADAPYGYQWWIGPEGAYYAAGKFAQLSIVFPQHDSVLAITAAVSDHEELLAHVWKHFPGSFGAGEARPGHSIDAKLHERCARLRLLPTLTANRSALMKVISRRTFAIEPNDDAVAVIRFDFMPDRCLFWLHDARGRHRIEAGLRNWIEGDTTMTGNELHHQYQPERLRVVAGAQWLDERTFEMTWQFVETAFRDRVVCRFEGRAVTVDRSVNVNSAVASRPTLRGRLSGKLDERIGR